MKKRLGLLALAGVLIAGVVLLCVGGPSEKRHVIRDAHGKAIWELRETCIPIERFNSRTAPPIPSPDLQHIAYVTFSGDNDLDAPHCAILDRTRMKSYDDVDLPVFSPDSKRLAYLAEKRKEPFSDHFVIVDGVESGPWSWPSEVLFSPDSSRWACVAEKDGRHVVLLDGVIVATHAHIDSSNLVFSRDSRHLAWVARDEVLKARPSWDVYFQPGVRPTWGRKELDPRVLRSDNGTALRERIPPRIGDNVSVRLDGACVAGADEVRSYSLRFAPDSKRLCFVYRMGYDWFYAFGDRRYGPYDEIGLGPTAVSLDSKRVAFVFRRGEHRFLRVDGAEWGPYAVVDEIRFSPDAKSITWIAQKPNEDSELLLFLDGKQLGVSCSYGSAFSPDGRHLAYARKADKLWQLVEDKNIVAEREFVHAPMYSPDSSRLVAVVAQGGKERLFERGKEGPAAERIGSVLFSADSKHVAYWASGDDGLALVVDGREVFKGPYALTLGWERIGYRTLLFTPEGRLRGCCFRAKGRSGRTSPIESEQIFEDADKGVITLEAVLFELMPVP